MRKCPYCAEEIEEDVATCPFCGSSVAEPAGRPMEPIQDTAPTPAAQPAAWAYGPGTTPPASSGSQPRGRSVRTVAFLAAAVVLLGTLALVVFLVSRSADDTEPRPAATPPATLAPGWTVVTETEDGFSIGLPEGWEESQFDVGENIRLQAIDASREASDLDFVPNLNVIAETLPFALSLDDYIQANLGQLEVQLQGVTGLSHQRVALPVGPAERIEYSFDLGAEEGEPFEVTVVQFVFIREMTGYIVTFETAPSQAAEYHSAFEQMAESFRFTD